MRGSPGGSDLTTPGSGTPTGFPVAGGYPVSHAFDNTNDVFYTGDPGKATFVDYDFGSATTIAEYAFTRDPLEGNIIRAPGAGYVIASDNRRDFALIDSYSFNTADYASGTVLKTFGSGGGEAPARRRLPIIVN